ncbi:MULTISPECIES: hypothetical protein [unclassified Paenibacillus]|uniref:hypothetical protein n=1 Tax=unclassified Paenibacillus TaxID=185978 RepID=UPI001043E0B7|nr:MULTISPECIES: hypothetical protein [unclassified Paenibacillus]NIK69528.1 hypothetical protein [Paenibacillus sp. BK720]
MKTIHKRLFSIILAFAVAVLCVESARSGGVLAAQPMHRDISYLGEIGPLITEKIKSADITSPHNKRSHLTEDEISNFIDFFKKLSKKDVTRYYGPAPKGGPPRLQITLGSDEKVSLLLNGDYILFYGDGKKVSQVYKPGLGMFTVYKIRHYK